MYSLITNRPLPLVDQRSTGYWKAKLMEAFTGLIVWITSGPLTTAGSANSGPLEGRLLAEIGLTRQRVEYIRRHDRSPKRWCHDDCQ